VTAPADISGLGKTRIRGWQRQNLTPEVALINIFVDRL
jgi:hypothetical protein